MVSNPRWSIPKPVLPQEPGPRSVLSLDRAYLERTRWLTHTDQVLTPHTSKNTEKDLQIFPGTGGTSL